MSSWTTPDWVKDAVFYQIFPDTFARSERVFKPGGIQAWDALPGPHGYKGGDLLGVVEHLDYLADLGINAIYFCPIFQSASNHRYHTHDYYQVDPMLGGNDAFRELVDEAHNRSIRIVIDGVFNHASRGFFQFNDILENGLDSAYVDWFVIKDRNRPLNPYNGTDSADRRQVWDPNYQCWWGLPPLPEFNTDNPEVREFLWDIASYWIDFGADGWRLDVPEDIGDPSFWHEFRRRVKKANPEAYIVGEIWHPAQEWLTGDRFDAVMNYVFNRAAQDFFGSDCLDTNAAPGGYALECIGAQTFAQRVDEMIAMYPWSVTQVQLNLLGSHDTPRILSVLGNDRDSLKLCWLFQMTLPGAPCVYYGDEIGMTSAPVQGHEGRAGMLWDEADWDHDLRDALKRYIALRKDYAVLRRGTFQTVHASDADNVYAFARADERETFVVLFNNARRPYELRVPVHHLQNGSERARCLLTDSLARVEDGHLVGTTVAPRSGLVLRFI